jgi:hypothetical protein
VPPTIDVIRKQRDNKMEAVNELIKKGSLPVKL